MTLIKKQPEMWLWSENGVHSKIWTELSKRMFTQMAVQRTWVSRLLLYRKQTYFAFWMAIPTSG